jgi:succinate-acetate transporter protein
MFEAIRFIVGFIALVVITTILANTMRGNSVEMVAVCGFGILCSVYAFYRVCIGPFIEL